MPFFTKVDFSRQVRQRTGSTATLSGSTKSFGNFSAYDCGSTSVYLTPPTFPFLLTGPSASTLNVGEFKHTSGTSFGVAITAFSAATGFTSVLSIGQPPLRNSTGGTTGFGISASTLQIARGGLLPEGFHGGEVDLQIDSYGNVTRATSSSLRYKYDFENISPGRYTSLLDLDAYFFKFKETGKPGFGLIAEELEKLGLHELIVYNTRGQPDNIKYKLLSVALLQLLKDLYKTGIKITDKIESDNNIKLINSDTIGNSSNGAEYITQGHFLVVVTEPCKIILNSTKDKKIKIKSLNEVEVHPDKGLIDNKWKSISLDGDSCIELVFVEELSTWVITSSDGIKNS